MESDLNSILPEYDVSSAMPTTLEEVFKKHNKKFTKKTTDLEISEVFSLERKCWYKTFRRTESGLEVVLITNPFTWKSIQKNGKIFMVRPKPISKGLLSDLQGKFTGKRKNSWKDDY